MYTNIEQRACDLAVFIIDNRATVRSAAKRFGISKSTVHKDLTERLPRVNPGLYKQVRLLLDINKAERHIRGGLATRRKDQGDSWTAPAEILSAGAVLFCLLRYMKRSMNCASSSLIFA